jgi:PTH1 family peptidyl-tRNA hydrolase
MEAPFLIVGLGNLGAEYAETRHNAGFLAAEAIARRWKGEWALDKKFNARLARVEFAGRKGLLCEPQTYMNASGESVGAALRYFKVPLAGLLVVVDDADLPWGMIRLRPRGSSGGHHGLESLGSHLGSTEFARLRIGIGRTDDGRREITNHVLGRFSVAEQKTLKQVLDRVAAQMECWLARGVEAAMNEFNGAVDAPPKKERQ